MTIRLPADLYEKLRQTAFDRRTTMNAIVADAVTEWMRAYTQ